MSILFFVAYIVMMSIMIILERDKPKNIIIWSVFFLLTSILGYIAYIVIRNLSYKKSVSLTVKLKEDEIYDNLISSSLSENHATTDSETLNFNSLAFHTHITANNNYEIFHDHQELKLALIEDLKKAKKYVIFEVTKINSKDFEEIKSTLINLAKSDVEIRLVYDNNISRKLIKELRSENIRVYKFSKNNSVGSVYANLRNAVTIDGETIYIANFNISKKQLKSNDPVASTYLKIKGDIVQDINVQIHKDTIFASGKFIPYEKHAEPNYKNNCMIQYVANQANTDLELAIIKAICMAKKSIQLELSKFIPTESIMSLLRFAINSNIDVRLMVPLKTDTNEKYYASRAYAKELALYGANVYLFDGYINFNAITIDDEFVVFGSYIIDREHLNTSPQSMLFIKDNKAVKNFNNMFNNGIENSYRINNAKFLLLREKFFKNFV